MTLVVKKRPAWWLAVLRWYSRLTGATIDLGLSTSSDVQMPVGKPDTGPTLTPSEFMLTVPRRRKPLTEMTDAEIEKDVEDRQTRIELLLKLRKYGIRLTNDQLRCIKDFDGPPMYIPRQENTVFVLSGHSLGNAPASPGNLSDFALENLVDGKRWVVSREQLESYFEKVS